MPASPLSRTTWPSPSLLCAQRSCKSPPRARGPPGCQPDGFATSRRLCARFLPPRDTPRGRLDPLKLWMPQSSQVKYPCTRRCVVLLIALIGAARFCSLAARLGVSPRANCSWRPPLPIVPTPPARMDADAHGEPEPLACSRRVFNVPWRRGCPGQYARPAGRRLRGPAGSQVHQQAIAQILRDIAVKRWMTSTPAA